MTERLFADEPDEIEPQHVPDEIEPEDVVRVPADWQPDDIEPVDAPPPTKQQPTFFSAPLAVTDVAQFANEPGEVSAFVPPAPALMQILPADFPLPLLIKFVPDQRLKDAIDVATDYAMKTPVVGADGLQRADLALGTLRGCIKAIEAEFAEPAQLANDLHKSITSRRAEWIAAGKNAVEVVGKRVWTEKNRLDAIASETRRQEQAEADRQARENAKREAEAAARAKAPAPIVQELQRQAETATAPPVTKAAAPVLAHSSTVTTWKARPKDTPGDNDPNPPIASMSNAQLVRVRELLAAILEDKAPITAIEINYSVLNGRAKADKTTFSVPGFEAFADGGTRGKGRR